MSQLFKPFAIGKVMLKNRIVIAPMCQYSAEDGHANDWHLIHLGGLALSGAGLLTIEATAVEPEGRITPADLGLWSDATQHSLQTVIHAIRKYSAIPLSIQLAHAGRKASCKVPWEGGLLLDEDAGGWPNVAPSALPFRVDDRPPIALDIPAMQRITQSFAIAAKRAYQLGIDMIELHAAHGYLLHQFLSPLSNLRTDAYGGSLENRMRFPLEVFQAIKSAVPEDMPVGIRISASDWVEGGWDVAQSIVFCQALKTLGCAFVHVSSGGLSPNQKIPAVANYQIPFADEIRKATQMTVIGVGLITEPEQAEAILVEGKADLIALARGMLYDPRWPWHAAAKLGASVDVPKQYWRSQPAGLRGLFGEM